MTIELGIDTFGDVTQPRTEHIRLGPGLVGQHSPGHVAETDDDALEQVWPHYRTYVGRLGRERGWPPPTRAIELYGTVVAPRVRAALAHDAPAV
jgi:hypothetical protein